jgi:hypothetical protein
MSFETTVRAFATSLGEPSAPPPATTHGRLGAPDVRRFAVYRNNVAVGLIGALEARYPVSRRIAGDDMFRAMARAFVRAHKPRSSVMIAYGEDFPEFMADYLAADEAGPGAVQIALEATERSLRRVSSPLVGEDRCANGIESAGLHHPIVALVDVARLENAWVEAYHAEDAAAATVGELATLSADRLPNTRIAFHPAARLMRFATPAASVWAVAQRADPPPASVEGPSEDALITRPAFDVRVRVLPPLAYDFALSLREGAPLIEAVAAVNDPAFDFGAHLVGLVESGAVASIIPGPSS